MTAALPDEAVVARIWDTYLHEYGDNAYVEARYFRPVAVPLNDDVTEILGAA
jgi:hypothetical protein